MASILYRRTVGDVWLIETDVSPVSGLSAPVGSIATAKNGDGIFCKFGSLSTDWVSTLNTVYSVNGYTGSVVLTTSDISEGTNLYFTNARVDSRVQSYTGDVTLSGTTFSIGALKVTNSMIANSTIDLTAKVTGILPVANGGTGVSTFGGTNTILYTTAADTLASSTNWTYDGTTVQLISNTSTLKLRSLVGTTTQCAIYMNQASPSATNYVLSTTATDDTILNTAAATTLLLRVNNATRIAVTNTTMSFTVGASSSGASTKMTFNQASHTAQTAGTEVLSVDFNNSFILQHSTGAITLQRTMLIRAMTYSFVGASTITDAMTLQIRGAPAAGANATLTRSWAFSVIDNAQFQNKVYIGADSTAPTAYLHLAAGLTTANNAPLKLTTQTNGLTTVEQGAFELIGNSLQFTQLAKRRGVAMGQSVRTSDTTVANTTTESAALITAEHSANYLEVGKCEEIVLRGIYSQRNNVNAFGTLRVKYAGTTIVTLTTPPSTSLTNAPFEIVIATTCRTTGASGTMQVNVRFFIDGVLSNGDTNASVSIDTTTAQDTTCTWQWNEANASDTMTVHQGRVLCIETNK